MEYFELVKIKKKDIDFNNSILIIWQSKDEKDPSAVVIPPNVLKTLKRYCADKENKDYIFYGYHKKPYSRVSIFYMVRSLAKAVGIEKIIGTHTFRRSRANHLLADGLSIYDVSKFLRHKNIETTTIYLKTDVKDLQTKLSSKDSFRKILVAPY